MNSVTRDFRVLLLLITSSSLFLIIKKITFIHLFKTSIALVLCIPQNALGKPYNLFDTFEEAEAKEFELFSELMKEKKYPRKTSGSKSYLEYVESQVVPQTYLCFPRKKETNKKLKETKYLTEKGFTHSQKYPSGVLMTTSKDFSPL